MELEETAPAFERRLDAPLVGRKRELAALRQALKRAVDGSTVRVALVTGSSGGREVAARGRAHTPREGDHDPLGTLPLLR